MGLWKIIFFAVLDFIQNLKKKKKFLSKLPNPIGGVDKKCFGQI